MWTLLVCAARDRRVYTYNEVRKVLRLGGAGVVSGFIDPVMRYCQQRGLPPLTVLVVNERTGLAGVGLTTSGNRDRERVFRHDWFASEPPETRDFDEAMRQQ